MRTVNRFIFTGLFFLLAVCAFAQTQDSIAHADTTVITAQDVIVAPVDSLLAETLEDEENDEILLLDNGTVDLDEVFTTALVLAMDSKHVCSEDCKGLCATCGADLNEGPCGCKPEIDPRFAALAQLLDKESE